MSHTLTMAYAEVGLDSSGPELLPPHEIRPPAGYDVSAVYTAPLASPWDMVFTPSGDILVAEVGLPRIRRVTLDGEISTFSFLPYPFPAIAYNAEGELFVGGGGGISKVSQDGKLTAFCKTSLTKMVLGPDGAFYTIDWGGSPDVKKITPDGNVSTYATGLSHASDIAFSPTGELYVADPGSRSILKVGADGKLTTVTTGFQTDYGVIVFDKEGHLFYFGWWADEKSWVGYGIFKISVSDGSVTPFVLNFYWGACSDFEIDDSGNIFGIGATLGALFKVSPDGKVEFIIEAWYNNRGLTVGPSGDLFIADIGSLCPLLSGKILCVGMDGNRSVFFDGLHQPRSLTFDASGNLFVADRDGLLKISPEDKMRVVTSEPGLMSIAFDQVSGCIYGFQCFSLQDQPPRLLKMAPDGNVSALPTVFNRDVYDGNLAVDSEGNILVVITYAENINVGPLFSELLKISPKGEVRVLAELVEYVPTWTCSLALGPSGDIYLLDHPSLKEEPSGFVIWKVTPQGDVSLFADRLPTDPFSIAVNSEGDVFFTCGTGIYRISAVKEGIVIDGLKNDWKGLSAMIVDPEGDWKRLKSDIKAVYGFTDDKNMYLMVEFYQFTDTGLDSVNVEVDFGDGRADYLCIFPPTSTVVGVTVLVIDLREGESSWTWHRRGLSYIREVAEMKMPLSYIENRKDFSLQVVAIGKSDGEYFHIDGTDWAHVRSLYAPKPAEFKVSDLSISPTEAEVKQLITISVNVTNIGEEEGSYSVGLKVAGATVDTRTVTLSGGESTTVIFELAKEEVGAFDVEVSGVKGTFVIKKISTAISCSVSPSEVTIGDSITVSGAITPALSGKTVTLTYKRPDGSVFNRTVTTGSDGSHSDSYKPDAAGSWSVIASRDGDSQYQCASSLSKAFTVKERPFIETPMGTAAISGGLIALIIVTAFVFLKRRGVQHRSG